MHVRLEVLALPLVVPIHHSKARHTTGCRLHQIADGKSGATCVSGEGLH